MSIEKRHNSGGNLGKYYGDKFYSGQQDYSLTAALKYADMLSAVIEPKTVVDVGCGRGSWLTAFKGKGASRLVGYDGVWNAQENMRDQSIEYCGVDLNDPEFVSSDERFDLALSVEVAEHLEPSSAEGFVRSLTCLSDIVLFGAAYTKQGGTNHINEQPQTYWADLFSGFDYIPYDYFRPVVWGDSEVYWGYQQNIFLYVKEKSSFVRVLHDAGHVPIKNVEFMNCVHPKLYEKKINRKARRLIVELLGRAVGIR